MKWIGQSLIIIVAAIAVAGVFAVLTRSSNGTQASEARFVPGAETGRSLPGGSLPSDRFTRSGEFGARGWIGSAS